MKNLSRPLNKEILVGKLVKIGYIKKKENNVGIVLDVDEEKTRIICKVYLFGKKVVHSVLLRWIELVN